MKIIFWGKGLRGRICLEKIINQGYDVTLVVGHENDAEDENSVISLAKAQAIETIKPENPNTAEFEDYLKQKNADVFILGGYGEIIKQNIIDIPKIMCLNLHGGKLPDMRGSSPLNWALIKNKKSFTLSVIKVNAGVDTGEIIHERTFDIDINSTIADIHKTANKVFPEMLINVLEQIQSETYTLKAQHRNEGAYFPLRNSDDGFILFDQMNALEIHNKIRALTKPYPCAFTYYKGRKVLLISSELNSPPYYGEPGKIYKKTTSGLLVCAKDECLIIKTALFDDNNEDILSVVNRYDEFLTVRNFILNNYKNK